MPYSKDNPPDEIADLTKKEQEIWISVFNDVFERTRKETQAFKSAWSAVGRGKNNSYNYHISFNRSKSKRIGEDEHFIKYKVILTRTGVMNGAYKSPAEIQNAYNTLSQKKYILSTNNHPNWNPEIPGDFEEQTEKFACGYVSNFKLLFDEKSKEPYIEGVDHVPKTKTDVWELLDTGKEKGGSIGYRAHWQNASGEWRGYKYNNTEHDMNIIQWAREITEVPACPPTWSDGSPGCGYVNEHEKVNKNDNLMKQNTEDDTMSDEEKTKKEDKTVVNIVNQTEINKELEALKNEKAETDKRLEEANKKIAELETKANKFDELAAKIRAEKVNQIKEHNKDLFTDDEFKEMTNGELDRIMKMIPKESENKDKDKDKDENENKEKTNDEKPPAKPLPTADKPNTKYDAEEVLRVNAEDKYWAFDKEKGEMVQKDRPKA